MLFIENIISNCCLFEKVFLATKYIIKQLLSANYKTNKYGQYKFQQCSL